MKILVSGGEGFIGSYLVRYLRGVGHKVSAPTHDDLDLLDKDSVDLFFDKKKFSAIVHTAAVGASRTSSTDVFQQNVSMFNNILPYAEEVSTFINLDSGAIFDKSLPILGKHIDEIKVPPADPYGMAKLENARKTLSIKGNNLRLYGCFGPGEPSYRFISTCILNAFNDEDTVVNDMYFDYICMSDVSKIINYCLSNHLSDIDLVYPNSGLVKLSNIARYVYSSIQPSHGAVRVEKQNPLGYYCGDFKKLNSLDIKLDGLENGINKLAHHIRQWMF